MQQHLRAARTRKGWSLDRLAAASGVNKSTISRLENGETKPMYETVKALEAALGLRRGTLSFGQSEALAS